MSGSSFFSKHYKSYKKLLLPYNTKKYKALIKDRIIHPGGRNTTGRITVRHRGGGSKTLYKMICFNYYELLPYKVFT